MLSEALYGGRGVTEERGGVGGRERKPPDGSRLGKPHRDPAGQVPLARHTRRSRRPLPPP